MSAELVLLAFLGAAHGAAAWGRDGHEIIAQVAQTLLTAEEVSRATSILGSADLASVANWADEVRHQLPWSFGLHFINVKDGACEFDFSRDCKDNAGVQGNCVAGAIMNYTAQLLTPADTDTRVAALKFVIHFVGDIHQPLHVGWTTDRGGNLIHVEESWEDDKRMDLHQVWDFGIIDGIESVSHSGEADIAKNLTAELLSGGMQADLKAWSSCMSSSDAAGLKQCVTSIALESVKDACEFAYVDSKGKKVMNSEDLDEAYFETRTPVVRSRLAAAGARLAAILKYALKASPMEPVMVFT